MIDTSGDVKNCYTYDPFGELYDTEKEEIVSNPFKFNCQYFDSEIDQYYLRARQYDPHIARFTARDPVFGKFKEPMTLHTYLYCLNDPVNRMDLSGEVPGLGIFLVGVGAIVDRAFQKSDNYYKFKALGHLIGAIGVLYEIYQITEWMKMFKETKIYSWWRSWHGQLSEKEKRKADEITSDAERAREQHRKAWEAAEEAYGGR